MKKSKKLYFIMLPFIAILLALGITVDCLMAQYSHIVEAALGDNSQVASEEYQNAALAASKEVNIELEREGAVLLSNEGALPLAQNSKVNLYGVISAQIYIGGTGSSATNARSVSFKEALESRGLTVNPTLWGFLEENAPALGNTSAVGKSDTGVIDEISVSSYEGAQSFAAAKNYSEVAIVTIGRSAGEESDPLRAFDDNSPSMLELQQGELDLLKKLDEEGFKVITLINSSNVIELGPVIQYSDAILWIGGTGEYGIEGVADILVGNTNPSGRLVDTWMYAQETSSSYYTSWAQVYDGTKDSKTGALSVVSNNEIKFEGSKTTKYYTNYNEGIYVGYKWYETADKEGYWDDVTDANAPGKTGYDAVVAYPFGYGLSYTEFSESMTADYDKEAGVITFTVTVSNDGAVAGKDVVEIYVEKPYTDGGVEVPEVELVGFDKTDIIEAGKSTTISTIKVAVDDLAVYNVNANDGKGCYELLEGEYKFFVASAITGAHIWKTADESRTWTTTFGQVLYNETARSSDYAVAVNQLETTDNDFNLASNDSSLGFKELSRANDFGNASETISKEAFPSFSGTKTLSAGNAVYEQIINHYDDVNTAHLEELVDDDIDDVVGADVKLSLDDLRYYDADGNSFVEFDEETGEKTVLGNVQYDDARWNDLISQMSVNDLVTILGKAGYGIVATESIGLNVKNQNYDGPTGLSNFMVSTLGLKQSATSFCTEPVMASTWNRDLLKEFGEKMGTECNAANYAGMYAPGLNLHRTPFGGRNGEYYSEDAFLSGALAAAEIKGLMSKGVYAYAKHFAFNEIEANRANMFVWIGEQAARETYLKAFEIAVKEGGCTGVMSSFMSVNGQWSGGNYNLITGILRKEWGFKGAVVTDTVSTSMSADKSLCAGSNLMLSTSLADDRLSVSSSITSTSIGKRAMKTATKQVLYMIGSASVYRELEIQDADLTLLNALFISLNVVGYGGFAVLTGLFAFFLVRDIKRKKSSEAAPEAVTTTETGNGDE